ncbi:phage holin family protein [Psychrobacter pygoscelis]|uniref:phage holin family protein n=1 Tax=Psychrobacter pygoscelis TaxID=2488563 RepID=UPI0010402FFC|nr:phage holin family protein [Psychrobacter pygoscelis]
MPSKDPTTYSALTYLWVFLLALSGGLVAFIRRLNKSRKPLPLAELFVKLSGELIISGFAGVLTFYLCEYWDFSQLLTAVFVAISGHLGGGAIDRIAKLWDLAMDKTI